jgi:putative flippase GtrA
MSLHKLLQRPRPGNDLLHWIHSFVLHVLTGFFAVAAHYALMYALVQAGVSGVLASSVGFAAGALTRFALSYWRVFLPTRGVTAASSRFVVAVGLQLLANGVLLAGLIEFGLSLWPAQVAATIIVTFANYLAYRLWVFR